MNNIDDEYIDVPEVPNDLMCAMLVHCHTSRLTPERRAKALTRWQRLLAAIECPTLPATKTEDSVTNNAKPSGLVGLGTKRRRQRRHYFR